MQFGPHVLLGHGVLHAGPNIPGEHSQYPNTRLQYPLAHSWGQRLLQAVPKNPETKRRPNLKCDKLVNDHSKVQTGKQYASDHFWKLPQE